MVGLLTALAVYKKRRKTEEVKPDYRAFFVLGISLLPMGAVLTVAISPGFIGIAGLGAAYLAIGLANRSKWKP